MMVLFWVLTAVNMFDLFWHSVKTQKTAIPWTCLCT